MDIKETVITNKNFDIILSGAIPPNPTQLLQSEKFSKMIKNLKDIYDYILIDSAPCLLVSDTFEISTLADNTVYVVRSNYTQKKLIDFVRESIDSKKLNGVNFVLNSIGVSASYGYKYSYQYGYKYGYKYSYNYGYGYGYNEDKDPDSS